LLFKVGFGDILGLTRGQCPRGIGSGMRAFRRLKLLAASNMAAQPVAFYAAVFFLVNATYTCLIWELIDRTSIDEVSPRVRRIMRFRSIDLMPFRDGCGCSAEISTSRSRNMYLLPRRLSETRSTGSWEANISGIKRTICIPAALLYPSLRSGEMQKRVEAPDRSTVEYPLRPKDTAAVFV
jgi:hypothetical protein